MDENAQGKIGSKTGWEKGLKPKTDAGMGRLGKPETGIRRSGKWESATGQPMFQPESKHTVTTEETPEGNRLPPAWPTSPWTVKTSPPPRTNAIS